MIKSTTTASDSIFIEPQIGRITTLPDFGITIYNFGVNPMKIIISALLAAESE
jgi:hypothetical protein